MLGPFNVNREQAWDSLRRQAELDVDIACFGHGNPVVGEISSSSPSASESLRWISNRLFNSSLARWGRSVT